jgi:hypothetical protein
VARDAAASAGQIQAYSTLDGILATDINGCAT